MTQRLDFPTGFWWGTASSGHQVEGNNYRNHWWAFEQNPKVDWSAGRSGRACNWWENAEQDFDRMQALHLNVHRLSLEWSRIEPAPGQFDHAALDRYRAMLAGLQMRGIRPVVALHHFTQPQWFAHGGGWLNPEAIDRFQRYTQVVVQTLGDLCDCWLTMNEPIVDVVQSWVRGLWPPQQRNPILAWQVLRRLLFAHAAAYHTIHAHQPTAQVSYTHAFHAFRGRPSWHPLHNWIAAARAYLIDHLWAHATLTGRILPPFGSGWYDAKLADTLDFIGVNYYGQSLVQLSPDPRLLFGGDYHPPGADYSDSGAHGPYSHYSPHGLYAHCLALRASGKPIFITENGLPDRDDDQRPRWILGHLAAIHRAIGAGCDIRGYFHWTFVDNFEWNEGWGLRFGLVELDPQTQVRIPRPSAHLYGEIARTNGIERALVEQYAPVLLAELFPAGDGAAFTGK